MNLSLHRAAMADVKDNKLLLAEMDLYLNRGCKEGTGPSVIDLDAQKEARMIQLTDLQMNFLVQR